MYNMILSNTIVNTILREMLSVNLQLYLSTSAAIAPLHYLWEEYTLQVFHSMLSLLLLLTEEKFLV
jgi:hypothetical protein